MGTGKVKSQCGQRIEDAEVAHVLAVQRFHAEDADDDLGRHAIGLFGPCQRVLVLLPESGAGLDAARLDEALAVCGPVFSGRAGRGQDQLFDQRQAVGFADVLAQPGGRQGEAGGRLVSPGRGCRVVGVGLVDQLARASFGGFAVPPGFAGMACFGHVLDARVFLGALGFGVGARQGQQQAGPQAQKSPSPGRGRKTRLHGGSVNLCVGSWLRFDMGSAARHACVLS